MRKIQLAITPELCSQLGITDSADDATIGAAIVATAKKAAKVDALQAQSDSDKAARATAETELKSIKATHAKVEITSMLDKALGEKRITVALKEQFAADYADKPEQLKKVLEGMGIYASVSGQISEATKLAAKKFEGKSWDELHEAGMLPDLKKNHLDLYKTLWEAEHGQAYPAS